MSCCNLAIKLKHFRQLILTLTDWQQIFSCLSLLSNISLDALIVPWMCRFTSHNLHKSFTAIFTPSILLDGFVFAAYLCLQRMFEAGEPAHNMRHNQILCDWLTATPMILNFRQVPPPTRKLTLLNYALLESCTTWHFTDWANLALS